MNFYPIFWKDMLVIRKKPWKFLASSMIMPLLYLVTFGWGLGRGMAVAGGGTYLDFVLPGLLAMSAMNNAFGPVSTSVNVSKLYTKTIEEVLVSPVSPWGIALGRSLTGLTRGMFSACLLLIVGRLSGGRLAPTPLLFLVLAVTAFSFASAAVAVAMVAKSHEDMSNFNSFIIIPMSFLAGTFFTPDRLPEPFRSAVLAYPLTHASLALRAIAAGGEPQALSLLVLAAYGVLFFYLAGMMVKRVL
jgi:ABC-2 type transport system permease protein